MTRRLQVCSYETDKHEFVLRVIKHRAIKMTACGEQGYHFFMHS